MLRLSWTIQSALNASQWKFKVLSFVRRECTGAIRRDKSDLHFHVFGILKQSTLLYIKSLMFQNVVHWKKCQILFTGPDWCLQQQGLKKTADVWESLFDQSPTVSHPSETATSWVGTGTVSPETESLFILLERLSSWEDSSGGKNTFITSVCQYRMHFLLMHCSKS